MPRIYFDKQIFSRFFKKDNSSYNKLLNDLHENKDIFLCFYSHAHLLDLKGDATPIKYKELQFMEELVNDNYLSYHALDKRTSVYLAKPLEAFKQVEEEEPIDFTKIWDQLEGYFKLPEYKAQVDVLKETLINQKFNYDFTESTSIPQNIRETIKKILPEDKRSLSILEFTSHMLKLPQQMKDDKSIYKDLRETIDKGVNNGKFTIDFNEIDFNEDLKNSSLKKTFIEYVNSNLNPNGNKQVTDYDFYANAYVTLDILGISKEPSKKVKFNNVLNDGLHSYYGAFCDYVVSDDQGFLKKTKALYKLLGIETKVYHIDEFLGSFNLIKNSFDLDLKALLELLGEEMKEGVLRKELRHKIATSNLYLGFFNTVEYKHDDSAILIRKETKNYSTFSSFREYESVINNATKHFGYDSYNKGVFLWDSEVDDINEGNWKGRLWKFNNASILIDLDKNSEEFYMKIQFAN